MAREAWMLAGVLTLTGCVEYGIEGTDKSVEEPIPTDTELEATDTEEATDTDDSLVDTDVVDETVADKLVYANTSDTLFEVEPSTGGVSRIGTFSDGVSGMVDIAIDTDGHMYGGTFDALYAIVPRTAMVTKICDIDTSMYALTFSSDGRLFAGGDATIVEIDIDDCSVRVLLEGSIYSTSGDLVGLPDGYLYWTVDGSDGDGLVRVDPNSGVTRWIGSIGTDNLFGLGYSEEDERLYGFSSGGDIVEISPVDASAVTLSQDEDLGWWGATTNPVAW